eukprot:scaffold10857_cov26-Prasinocladus_malaysianus.AAC.1
MEWNGMTCHPYMGRAQIIASPTIQDEKRSRAPFRLRPSFWLPLWAPFAPRASCIDPCSAPGRVPSS